MSKPVGYFGLSHSNQLIAETVERWGENLRNVPETDKFWLIGRLGHDLWLRGSRDEAISDFAFDYRDRLHELSQDEKIALIKALLQ